MDASVVREVTVGDLEFAARDLETPQGLAAAAAAYREHGCLVVRGLFAPYVARVAAEIRQLAATAVAHLPSARQVSEGWVTPDGTLFLPAPQHFERDKQIMILPYNYNHSAAFFASALDKRTLDLVEAVLGPNLELFGNGQCVYKEAVGGHPKHLHQDSAYFEHKLEGPMAALNYVVDTNLQNGALHVVPGSHRLGQLRHVDTFSHLGLDEDEWPWEAALPIEGKAGDSIFFHVKTIHGSKENHGNEPRPVAINRYRAAQDYVVISATTAQNREQAQQEAQKARKENQLGLMVRGFRAFDGDRVR